MLASFTNQISLFKLMHTIIILIGHLTFSTNYLNLKRPITSRKHPFVSLKL